MKLQTKKLLWGTAGTFIALFPAMMLGHVEGPDVRHTGGPGDVQVSCGDPAGTGSSSCHTNSLTTGGPINSFGGSVTATFSTGFVYVPGGAPITITVTVTDPASNWSRYFGFQMSARLDSDQANGQAGHFTATQPNTGVFCDTTDNFAPNKGCGVYPNGHPAAGKPVVEFMEHAFPSQFSSAQTTPYTFTWTPPATDVGPVHFYLAGNAVNNDQKASGLDHVYTANYTLTPATAPPAPSITLVANAEGESPTIAPNTWVEIKGSNLSLPADSRIWQGSDFVGSQMPKYLDGVSATVNGKDAYIWYISPTQVNILTPPDAISGATDVVVTTLGGSTTATAPAADISPSFFVFDGKHVAAVHLGSPVTFVGPASLYPELSTPAKPGETVVIYANGFGPTSTAVISGSSTQSGTLSPPPVVTIGNVAASVQFAGLVAPGEFQFNVVVPQVADGDQPIVATYNGASTQTGAVITIQH
ncbi:MAG: hypothetical protein LAO79_07700 [Acidobacteriia bacterium]|nr:hypothetical protein [Terriglobia bacterium]